MMKDFKQIIKSRLLSTTRLDDCQFAYKKNRSNNYACISIDYIFSFSSGTTIKFCSNFIMILHPEILWRF